MKAKMLSIKRKNDYTSQLAASPFSHHVLTSWSFKFYVQITCIIDLVFKDLLKPYNCASYIMPQMRIHLSHQFGFNSKKSSFIP